MRKINELVLKVTYETNHDSALASKMLTSLAFEKKEKIGDSYDMILQEIKNVCDKKCLKSEKIEKIDGLCVYFGSTYIKTLVPNREVLFPPYLWNQRDAAVSGIARTTNAVEGWHFGGIHSYFSGAHPNIRKVVGSLRKDASVQNSTFLMHRVAINSQKRKSIEF